MMARDAIGKRRAEGAGSVDGGSGGEGGGNDEDDEDEEDEVSGGQAIRSRRLFFVSLPPVSPLFLKDEGFQERLRRRSSRPSGGYESCAWSELAACTTDGPDHGRTTRMMASLDMAHDPRG